MTYSWGIANFKTYDIIFIQLNIKGVCPPASHMRNISGRYWSRVPGAESQNTLQKLNCKIQQSVSETEHLTR